MARIKGLTLWRPWPWAILHGKDIENRSWRPALRIGDWIALHAGKTWDAEQVDFIQRTSGLVVPPEAEHPIGVIVGVAQLVDIVEASDSPWFFGPVGWQLGNRTRIEPVPCRGMPGLFPLPADVLAQGRAGYRETTRRAA